MDWITGIQRAIDYVEVNIMDNIDYEKVAREAYSSSFHFQRVFSILCGYTIGDYIRMRRLSLAGVELATSDSKIIDIALKYGYNTPESFSRAFTRFHGITPSQAKNGKSIKSFSRISVKLILDGGSTMNYRIETKKSFQVVCRKKKAEGNVHASAQDVVDFWNGKNNSKLNMENSPGVEITKFWGECIKDGTIPAICKYIPEENIFGDAIVGISFSRDEKDEKEPYGIGAPYNGEKITEENLVIETIPEYTYAIFKCEGEMPGAFERTYKQIYTEFFPTSGYEPCPGVSFEAYPSADVNDPNYTCEIWVSVKKK